MLTLDMIRERHLGIAGKSDGEATSTIIARLGYSIMLVVARRFMHHPQLRSVLFVAFGLLASNIGIGKPPKFQPNYDESAVPQYILPDPLVTQSGQSVTTREAWTSRRDEILGLFEEHVYGRSPDAIPVEAIEVSRTEFDSMLRREIDITLRRSGPSLTMSMLVYTPRSAADKPCPLFLGLNFGGNHTVDPNPSIRITQSWVSNRRDGTTNRNQATGLGRGRAAKRWPIESIVDAGYGLATIHYSDIDPDFDDGFENGLHGLFPDWAYDVPKLQRWGSIAAWAYGLSRAMDVLVDDPLVASDQVAVFGHSRLGKTALWAGAMDERFALVISNNSGCGGAALSRRAVGETVGKINRTFPHWFADKFNDYNENESELPVDQHQLISLIAPRPVYVASATKDRWADPKGEYLAALAASPVYRLFGLQGVSSSSRDDSMPPPDQSLQSGMIGYHLRSGKHDVTLYDWDQYIRFADRVMQPPPSATQHSS